MNNVMSCMKGMRAKYKDLNNMVYKRSVDIKVSLADKNDQQTPIKCINFHHDCTIPLIKITLITLGVFVGLTMFMMLLKKWLF